MLRWITLLSVLICLGCETQELESKDPPSKDQTSQGEDRGPDSVPEESLPDEESGENPGSDSDDDSLDSGEMEEPSENDGDESDQDGSLPAQFIPDEQIRLDAYGESFQASIATRLKNSHYMSQNCSAETQWAGWQDLPVLRCRYFTKGQNAEVLVLNPGPRRLTLWLEEACGSFAKNFQKCMDDTFKQVIYQSGGQFPVAGVVIEDMDGDGRGNAYAFRNGVTIKISAFGTGTSQVLSRSQVLAAFTQGEIQTYTYARIVSVTREQMTSYANYAGLDLPNLGSSSQRWNVWNEVVGELYHEAWYSSVNHLIRAWVFNQGF